MTDTQFGWLLLGLAMGASVALAWRQGSTLGGRLLGIGLYGLALAALTGGLLVVLTGAAVLLGSPALETARRLLPAGVGGFWLAGMLAALLRIRRAERE